MESSATCSPTERSDPRIVRSEAAIRGALMDLLRSGRSYDSLTVSEVAERAGVTRKTFYARGGALDEVVRAQVVDLFADVNAQIDDTLLHFPLTDRALSRLVFGAWEARQADLGPLIRLCPASLFTAPLQEATGHILDRALAVNVAPPMSEARRDYVVGVIAGVVHGVLSVWVRREFSETPEEIAELVDSLLASGVERILLGAGRM